MLYPNLQINISKHKRTANGLEDASANLINTPVILDLAVQMSDEKNNSFAFSHQPSLNQFKQDQEKHISLQTPVLEINNHTPFFQNQNSLAISPGDNLNDFVAPNEILNTFTSATSTSTSTTTNANLSLNSNTYDLNQQHQLTLITDLNDQQLNQQLNQLNSQQQQKLIQLSKQETNNLQDYSNHFTLTSSNIPSYTQLNQYNSNLLNQQQQQQQQNDLNDNLSTITLNSHLTQDQHHHNLTYTELKPSNQQQLLIPNSVYDIAGFNKKIPSTSTLQTNYLSPASPAESISSHTSSSNLDNGDLYSYMSSGSGLKNDCSTSRGRRYGQMSNNEKKSRLTKKQKYDQMLNEEKNLLKNNDQLKDDIKNLEDLIIKYKKTIMNTVKNNK